MCKVENLVDTSLIAIGTTYSVANIEHLLGIVLLIIQIVWILTRLTISVVRKVKSKQPLDSIKQDFDSAVEDLKLLSNKQKGEDDVNGQHNE